MMLPSAAVTLLAARQPKNPDNPTFHNLRRIAAYGDWDFKDSPSIFRTDP